MKITTKAGNEIEVSLDFDKVCEYERKNPEWSIITEVRQFGKTMRFNTLNVLVGLTDFEGDWKEWVRSGLTIGDLTDVISDGLNELGFGSEDAESAE